MNHHNTASVLAFLAIISSVSAHISGGHIGHQKVVYCGRNLANILAQLCEGVEKRSETDTILSPYYKEQDLVWPWITHHKARALGIPRGKRYQDGIVSECCENPCSKDELLQYCYNEN
ncbi:bombyxin A-2 homolog [Plodia interpunctella]|uniref:bombyxin A-2 homolog n=1 Tax=Plodia interpunctella TaxID=58824 RepID=UPI002367E1C4|nr:bombyxin A-2 homolog [Plodia interpunctella]XP_053600078.1 bombyxin A-2 homolog [Plodia interpunctella]